MVLFLNRHFFLFLTQLLNLSFKWTRKLLFGCNLNDEKRFPGHINLFLVWPVHNICEACIGNTKVKFQSVFPKFSSDKMKRLYAIITIKHSFLIH